MKQRAVPRPFSIVAAAVFLLAVVVLLVSIEVFPLYAPPVFWLLACAVVVAENLSLDLPGGGSMSIAYPLSLAAAVLLGPTATALVAALSGISFDDFRRGTPVPVVAFNLAQLILSSVLGTWAYIAAGGRTLYDGNAAEFASISAADFPHILWSLFLLATVSYIINAGLVSVGVSLFRGIPMKEVWKSGVAWTAPLQFALALLGFVIAEVLAVSLWGFVLFVVPLAVSRQMHLSYIQLKDAYVDTVRSLVGAIEAKDPYTRGHSERVARFAQQIAVAMNVPEAEVERLRLAALLHDLGKVGISHQILRKPARLTDSEYGAVQEHPDIGANIVSRIPNLADIENHVRFHHERVDGHGYAAGLAGDEIPLGARILAVADSFDAMTSARAYRPAMSDSNAKEELRRCSGSQFDSKIVDALIAALEGSSEQEEQIA
ncbi:MAG: HD-GYP domain-containing protein [Actinomycetota bacterium]|jgi:hypothetical protein|nr:HD-GYP domain-containing protein [Actinomycetota bacterium]